jgi:hypothetical protein
MWQRPGCDRYAVTSRRPKPEPRSHPARHDMPREPHRPHVPCSHLPVTRVHPYADLVPTSQRTSPGPIGAACEAGRDGIASAARPHASGPASRAARGTDKPASRARQGNLLRACADRAGPTAHRKGIYWRPARTGPDRTGPAGLIIARDRTSWARADPAGRCPGTADVMPGRRGQCSYTPGGHRRRRYGNVRNRPRLTHAGRSRPARPGA